MRDWTENLGAEMGELKAGSKDNENCEVQRRGLGLGQGSMAS